MARRFIILQKKLQELEPELADVFRLPLDQTAAEHMHMQLDDIKERFRFLDKLRAAEADSDSDDQLRDVDERIARLKAAFSDWRNRGFGNDDNNNDALSICSDCNMQQALLLEDSSGKNLSEKEEKAAPAPAVGRSTSSGIGKYCGAFGGGMIVGMVLGLFYAHYLITDEALACLIPPT